MFPFISNDTFKLNDIIIIKDIKSKLANNDLEFDVKIVREGKAIDAHLKIDALTDDEREIIKQGCLINYYKSQM